MGIRAAPSFANVCMGKIEPKYVQDTEWKTFLIDWVASH